MVLQSDTILELWLEKKACKIAQEYLKTGNSNSTKHYP